MQQPGPTLHPEVGLPFRDSLGASVRQSNGRGVLGRRSFEKKVRKCPASYRGLEMRTNQATFTLIDKIRTYIYEFFVNFDKPMLGILKSYPYLGIDIESETSNNTIK